MCVFDLIWCIVAKRLHGSRWLIIIKVITKEDLFVLNMVSTNKHFRHVITCIYSRKEDIFHAVIVNFDLRP